MKKKCIYILILSFIDCLTIFAQDQYNQNQAQFRNDINKFLREEGYLPSINSRTGEINFKMESTNYAIGLDADFKGPYLVILSATFNMDELSYSDKQKLYEVENTINSKYNCVKASYLEYEDTRLLVFSIESFCHNSDDFKYALIKYLESIKSAIREFGEEYSGNNSSNTTTKHIAINNSNTLRTSSHSWTVVSIDFTTNETILTKTVKPHNNSTYIYSTKDEFIEDADTGQKYYIRDSSIGFTRTILKSIETKIFTESYPLLPSNVKRINISSGSYYYIKNLQIR